MIIEYVCIKVFLQSKKGRVIERGREIQVCSENGIYEVHEVFISIKMVLLTDINELKLR